MDMIFHSKPLIGLEILFATEWFQSSSALFDVVQSYRSHPKRVRDLTEELEGLTGVLGALAETLNANTDTELASLEYPLLRCANACEDFEDELKKCSTRSLAGKTSFRDWAKLKYMGEDIDGFRRMLAGYKSTIIIALTNANLCVSLYILVQFLPLHGTKSLTRKKLHLTRFIQNKVMVTRDDNLMGVGLRRQPVELRLHFIEGAMGC